MYVLVCGYGLCPFQVLTSFNFLIPNTRPGAALTTVMKCFTVTPAGEVLKEKKGERRQKERERRTVWVTMSKWSSASNEKVKDKVRETKWQVGQECDETCYGLRVSVCQSQGFKCIILEVTKHGRESCTHYKISLSLSLTFLSFPFWFNQRFRNSDDQVKHSLCYITTTQ